MLVTERVRTMSDEVTDDRWFCKIPRVSRTRTCVLLSSRGTREVL